MGKYNNGNQQMSTNSDGAGTPRESKKKGGLFGGLFSSKSKQSQEIYDNEVAVYEEEGGTDDVSAEPMKNPPKTVGVNGSIPSSRQPIIRNNMDSNGGKQQTPAGRTLLNRNVVKGGETKAQNQEQIPLARIISLVFLENIVDGSQQHSGDGNDGFLVSAPLFDRVIAVSDFGVFVTLDSGVCTLHKQRFNIYPGTSNTSGFLLTGTTIPPKLK